MITTEAALFKLKAWRKLSADFGSLGDLITQSLKRKRMITDHAIWVNLKEMLEWKPGQKQFEYPSIILRQPVSQWIKDQ